MLMQTKDYFSDQSKIYATFRPTYPDELYQFIFKHLKNKNVAWDCATGNGQVAQYLAPHFQGVYATDISQQQIDNATQASNIFYSVGKAEETGFKNNQFDLITVGQALHWFNRQAFYKEVKRIGKPDGLIAVWGYANLNISPAIDKPFMDFYNNTVGPYWDEARRLVEREYEGVEFPFQQIPSPKFQIKVNWTLERLSGYLSSWSATQKFIKTNGYNPVDKFIQSLSDLWKPGESKSVTFPVFLKLGKIGDYLL